MPPAIRDEDGFTLIELLVVILVIGILAAIAIPSFLNQRGKGQDTDAKANARSMVTQLEACYATEQDYTQCGATIAASGLPVGNALGQVEVATIVNGYTVTARSHTGGRFIALKDGVNPLDKTCVGGTPGCNNGTW